MVRRFHAPHLLSTVVKVLAGLALLLLWIASCIEGYAPYDNSVAADYPALYVTAGLTDPRVSVHEPAKWVAKLRTVNTGERPLLLRTEMEAGHGGVSGRFRRYEETALEYAFMLDLANR